MAKGPGLFSDIGKKAKDHLTKGYSTDHKVTISTYSSAGVALTLTAVNKGAVSTRYLAAKYKHKNAVIDVKVDAKSNISTTVTINGIIQSTKTISSFKLLNVNSGEIQNFHQSTKTIALFKLPDFNSGKLEVQYFHDHATLTAAFGIKQSPVVDVSATIGTPSFAIGAEAGYDTANGSVAKYAAGISVNRPDSCASIILGDKGKRIKASYVHYLDKPKKSAAVAEITRKFSTNENTFTVGGSFAIDHRTQVKARLNNHGKLGALLQHDIMPKSVMTLSGEVNTKTPDRKPRFGLAIALKP